MVKNEAIVKCMNKSNLMKHALDELEIAGFGKDAKALSLVARNNILELLTVFCSHENSGMSAPLEIEMFRRLAKYNVLSPLTLADDEFMEVGTGVFQNRRVSSIFKEEDRIYDIECYTLKTERVKKLESDKLELMKLPGFSRGYVYERYGNIATGRYFSRCFLPQECDTWMPQETIVIPTISVETSKDDWTNFFEKDCEEIKKLESLYEIQWKMSEEWKGKEIAYENED